MTEERQMTNKENKLYTTVQITRPVLTDLKVLADEEGRSLSGEVEYLIYQRLSVLRGDLNNEYRGK